MKFGITPFEGDDFFYLYDPKKGLDSFTDFRFSDLIMKVIDHGYEHCEISLDIFQILPIKISEEEKRRLLNFKKKYDITFSAHFPLWCIELASPNKYIREGSIKSLIDSYNTFKFMETDIDVFILHPTGAFTAEFLKMDLPKYIKQFIITIFTGYALDSIKQIIRETNIDKSKIAIENIEFPFEGTLDIIKKLKGPKLCIDTAHFLGGFSGDVDLIEITKENLDLTSEIHLQDFNQVGDADHGALGTGKNFPIEFLKIINEYDFKGPVVFELPFEKAYQSVQFIKQKTPEIVLPEIKP